MKKSIKLIGMLLVLAGVLSIAGIVATNAHATGSTSPASMQSSHKIVSHSSCSAALVTMGSETECIAQGIHGEQLSGVTQICNEGQYPVNFIGETSGFHVIMPG